MIQPPLVDSQYIQSTNSKSEKKEQTAVFDEWLQTAQNKTDNEEASVDALFGLVVATMQPSMVQLPTKPGLPIQINPKSFNLDASPLTRQPLMENAQLFDQPFLQQGNDQALGKVENNQPLIQLPVDFTENEVPFLQQKVVEAAPPHAKSQVPVELLEKPAELLSSLQPEILQMGKKNEVPIHGITNGFIPAVNTEPTVAPLSRVQSSETPIPTVPVRLTNFDQDVQQFFQAAIKMHQATEGIEATFSLQPEQLGKVEVKVLIKDGKVTAEFIANTQMGKDVLLTNVLALHTALEQQGFQVDKIDVIQQYSHLANSFSQKGDSNQRQSQPDSRKRNDRFGQQNEENYHDFSAEIGWGSQINTTV
ncbi:flagellar hook-length control protein FliK [Neobacillus sp. 19]|uniref:flagellar hook-length control protein FliK n=1 Tax=Neobacillus sp. 19 TaxID=3394458 RepID=UPI003BF6E447